MKYSHVTSKGEYLEDIIDNLFSNKQNGVFIELGANNGLTQSNTAFLEFERNWTGILIEPSINAFHECVKNRPNSQCFHLACVASDTQNSIQGDFHGSLMSSVNGERLHTSSLVEVKADTLSNIIKQSTISIANGIDFLSLDVEGFELEVLKGLDFAVHRPKYMLIEVYTKDYDMICTFLESNKYKCVQCLTNYNKVDNPHWDGTHNDYLFIDTLQSSM